MDYVRRMVPRLVALGALIHILAGCGLDPGGSHPANPDAAVIPRGVSVRRDGVALCVGETFTAVDRSGQNRIDVDLGGCSTPVTSTFFEMFDADKLPCVDLRVSNLGCSAGFIPTGSLTRKGTTATGTCTCHYQEIIPGGTNIPHTIELTADVDLAPG